MKALFIGGPLDLTMNDCDGCGMHRHERLISAEEVKLKHPSAYECIHNETTLYKEQSVQYNGLQVNIMITDKEWARLGFNLPDEIVAKFIMWSKMILDDVAEGLHNTKQLANKHQ